MTDGQTNNTIIRSAMGDNFSEDVYRDQLYTEQQSRWLTNLPRLSAPLSMAGSSLILFIIWKDRHRKLRRVYHRLLLAYSAVDLLCSFNYALSAAVVPKGTPGVWGAHGTLATCEASGFVTQFTLSQGVYGSFICLYYVLVLRYQVKEQTLASRIEPFVHVFALGMPFILGSLQLVHGNYNPTNVMMGWCFINVYPMDCLRREEVECQRGENYEFWLILNNIPFFVFLAVVIASCVLTFLKVRSLETRGSRWRFSQLPSRSSEGRIRETAKQAASYIMAFFLTYIFFGIGTLFGPSPATERNRSFYLPIVVLTKLFLPLPGFWNAFIYIRPRFYAIRLRQPEQSTWAVFQTVLRSSDETNSGGAAMSGASFPYGPRSSMSMALGAMSRWVTTSSHHLESLWRSGRFEVSPSSTKKSPPDSCVDRYSQSNMDIDEFIPEFNHDILPFGNDSNKVEEEKESVGEESLEEGVSSTESMTHELLLDVSDNEEETPNDPMPTTTMVRMAVDPMPNLGDNCSDLDAGSSIASIEEEESRENPSDATEPDTPASMEGR